ncbi:hypothetical protein DVH05_007420 [Phytophthora capsici]|nr:hypothetical protein DVH05_007420 [Phytophthora capsici]
MELRCGVYGEGSVFSVKIARDVKVSALQKKIASVLSTEQHTVFPRLLALYLARKKEGEEVKWLKDDRHAKDFLRGGTITEYEEMRPSWTLDDEELFGPDFQPGQEEIHVLVELPKAAVESASLVKMEKQLDEMYERIAENKRKRYVHSEMSLIKGRALLQDLKMRLTVVDTVPFTTTDASPVQVPAFEWESICDGRGQNIALTEEQQRVRYREYVENNIGDVLTTKKLCVLGVEKGMDILSVAVPGHDIDLAGRSDILVLSALAKQSPFYLEILPEVKMVIEVKRVLKSGCTFQALSELIALDFLVDDPVMALLTNLTDHWQFFWVSDKKKKKHVVIHTTVITETGAAFAVIKTLLAQSSSADAEINLPCIEEPVKRRKLAEVLPSVSEGGESNGVREAIERYYDIASVLGPDIEMARAVANQVTRSIPIYSSYPS